MSERMTRRGFLLRALPGIAGAALVGHELVEAQEETPQTTPDIDQLALIDAVHRASVARDLDLLDRLNETRVETDLPPVMPNERGKLEEVQTRRPLPEDENASLGDNKWQKGNLT